MHVISIDTHSTLKRRTRAQRSQIICPGVRKCCRKDANCGLTHELDPGNQRLLTPSSVFGMYITPTVPTTGAIFKYTALREQGVVETIWFEYVTEPSFNVSV